MASVPPIWLWAWRWRRRRGPDGRELRRLFLESKPKAVWHPGMLIEDSLIQISVLKDLATIRNPQSRFTFLNYLKVKGRLFEFLNLRDLFPTPHRVQRLPDLGGRRAE